MRRVVSTTRVSRLLLGLLRWVALGRHGVGTANPQGVEEDVEGGRGKGCRVGRKRSFYVG